LKKLVWNQNFNGKVTFYSFSKQLIIENTVGLKTVKYEDDIQGISWLSFVVIERLFYFSSYKINLWSKMCLFIIMANWIFQNHNLSFTNVFLVPIQQLYRSQELKCILWNYCVLQHSSTIQLKFHNERAIIVL